MSSRKKILIDESLNWTQILSTLVAASHMLSTGIHSTWTSVAFVKFEDPDSTIHLTAAQQKWMIVTISLGGICGATLIYNLSSRISRKICITFIGIGYITAWTFIILATSPTLLLISRFISGFTDCGVYIIVPMYVGEIAHQKVRGFLCSIMPLFLMTGQLLTALVGSVTTITQMALAFITLPLVALIFTPFIPESPYYLVGENNTETARGSLVRLRIPEADIDEELERVTKLVTEQRRFPTGFSQMLRSRINRRALFMVFFLRFFEVFVGWASFSFYNQTLFKMMMTPISPETCSIIYFTIMLIVTSISSLFIDSFGRRKSLMVSAIGCSIILILGGFVNLILKESYDNQHMLMNINGAGGNNVNLTLTPNQIEILRNLESTNLDGFLQDPFLKKTILNQTKYTITISEPFSFKNISNQTNFDIVIKEKFLDRTIRIEPHHSSGFSDLLSQYPWLKWQGLLVLCGFNIFFSCGYATVPITILGEVFPTNFKAQSLAFAEYEFCLLVILDSQIFRLFLDNLGIYSVFLFYGIISFGAFLFAMFCVIETKGKTLTDIQRDLARGSDEGETLIAHSKENGEGSYSTFGKEKEEIL